jgi:hypothetical protein
MELTEEILRGAPLASIRKTLVALVRHPVGRSLSRARWNAKAEKPLPRAGYGETDLLQLVDACTELDAETQRVPCHATDDKIRVTSFWIECVQAFQLRGAFKRVCVSFVRDTCVDGETCPKAHVCVAFARRGSCDDPGCRREHVLFEKHVLEGSNAK